MIGCSTNRNAKGPSTRPINSEANSGRLGMPNIGSRDRRNGVARAGSARTPTFFEGAEPCARVSRLDMVGSHRIPSVLQCPGESATVQTAAFDGGPAYAAQSTAGACVDHGGGSDRGCAACSGAEQSASGHGFEDA